MLLKHGEYFHTCFVLLRENRHVFYPFSGVGFNDVLARYGLLEDSPRPPFVPGFECSGEVLEIGTNVTHVDVSSRESHEICTSV